jgi:hypothetical protein
VTHAVYEGNFLPLGTVVFVMSVGLVMLAVWIWSLVDALRFSDQRWVTAGQSKVLWVILIVLLGLLGSLLYVVVARPAVLRQEA